MNKRFEEARAHAKEHLPRNKCESYLEGMFAFEQGFFLIETMYEIVDEKETRITSPDKFFVAGFIDAMAAEVER